MVFQKGVMIEVVLNPFTEGLLKNSFAFPAPILPDQLCCENSALAHMHVFSFLVERVPER